MELTKEYFDQQLGNLATKNDLEEFREDFRAVKNEVAEMKQTLNELNKRDKEDSDAFAKILVRHHERLTEAEDNIKRLKLKQV